MADYTDYSSFDYSGASLYDTGYTPYNGGFGSGAVSTDQYGNIYDSSGQYIGNTSDPNLTTDYSTQITAPSYANTPIDLSMLATMPPTSVDGSSPSNVGYDQTTGLYYDLMTGAYTDSAGNPLVDTSTASMDPNFTDFGNGTSNLFDPTANTNTFYDSNLGETTVTNADGSGSFTAANGDYTEWTPEGKMTTTFANGDVAVVNPDNTSSYSFADGRSAEYDASGNLMSYFDPTIGYSYEVNPKTGQWTEAYADGGNCTGDFSGNYCCSDGTCTPAWQDRATNTNTQRTPGPASGGTGGGGGSKPGQAPAQLPQAKPTTAASTPAAVAAMRAQQLAAQRAAMGLAPTTSGGINIGGTQISWVWIAIAAVALFAIT